MKIEELKWHTLLKKDWSEASADYESTTDKKLDPNKNYVFSKIGTLECEITDTLLESITSSLRDRGNNMSNIDLDDLNYSVSMAVSEFFGRNMERNGLTPIELKDHGKVLLTDKDNAQKLSSGALNITPIQPL